MIIRFRAIVEGNLDFDWDTAQHAFRNLKPGTEEVSMDWFHAHDVHAADRCVARGTHVADGTYPGVDKGL